MPRFRKKPVVIEAHQWTKNGDHPDDYKPGYYTPHLEGMVVGYYRGPRGDMSQFCEHCGAIMRAHGWIDTLEGGHIVCPGDWIITGVHGERYPCKPDIFKATYELVEEDT